MWSAYEPADLFDTDVSPTDSVESLFDILCDHIPGYLSDTSSFDTPDSMPDLQMVSESSVSSVSSMPSLRAVSPSLSSSTGDRDWLSEVGDVVPGDDLDSQLTESDLNSIIADISPGEEDLVATMLTEVVKPNNITCWIICKSKIQY